MTIQPEQQTTGPGVVAWGWPTGLAAEKYVATADKEWAKEVARSLGRLDEPAEFAHASEDEGGAPVRVYADEQREGVAAVRGLLFGIPLGLAGWAGIIGGCIVIF